MKGFLKYLIILLAVMFLGDISKKDTISFESPQYVLTETDYDFCLPRQISSSSATRTKCKTRRTDNLKRHNFEFIKAGKTLHTISRCSHRKRSINYPSTFYNSSKKLAYLCKLII